MKRITLAWALTLCSFITFIACSSPDVGERSVSIIPAPAQMTVGEGTFTIHPGIEIGYADESLKGMGELLSNEIEKLSGIKLASASDKESNCIIFLELTDPKEFADLPKAYGEGVRLIYGDTIFRCISLLLRSRGSETSDRYGRLI